MLVSILIGAGSHLFWDSFTHVHGYFVRVIPVLTYHIRLFGLEVPAFKVIQHASTIAGGIIIILAVYLLPTTHKAGREAADSKYWISFLALTLAIIAVRMMTGLELKQYGDIIVTGIAAGMIALILTPMMIRLKRATPQ